MRRYGLLLCLITLLHGSLIARADDLANTKYPIVLVHGLMGFGDEMEWLSNYFGEIPAILRENGATVYIANLSPINTVAARGEQLYTQLRQWGHDKYNIIGHSQGGLDARYVLGKHPHIIASITTVATPHHGSKVADNFHSIMSSDSMVRLILFALADFFAETIGTLSGNIKPQNIRDTLNDLTSEGAEEFNQTYPIGIGNACQGGQPETNGIKLYSWGAQYSGIANLDLLAALFDLVNNAFDRGEENDGLVAVCSMKFGRWLGTLNGHHLVPVGGVLTQISSQQKAAATSMFLTHALRLKRENL